ncbi:response regulator transcription factor [Thiomicrospira microaerophila]|uniref:response regulator n=1 Tax=Thiomicrospira microaerophila TaxID=406020 RepID=UPI00200BD679|nr:response regulator transcription factor [Thiomicrospira microaerophila]UQB43202.1 response regulator transcription factor [Thiomicrospira microaerophila]
MAKKINLLLAENHDLVRESLKLLIEADSNFKVVAEAEDGIVCMEQVRAKDPDIVVLGLAMPKLNGLNTISQLKRRHPNTKIFVLTAAETPTVWQEALELGAHGIATKRINKKELIAGLSKVFEGDRFISEEIKPHVVNLLDADANIKKKRNMRKLSVREKQVTKLIAEGYKTKDIAEMLEISDRTVSKHRENLMTKLGATSPAEITHYATDSGLTKVKLLEIE